MFKEFQFFGFKYIFTSKKALIYSSIGLIVILTLVLSTIFYTTAQFDIQLQNDLKSIQNSDLGTNIRTGTFHYDLGIGGFFNVNENKSLFTSNFNSIKDTMLTSYNLFASQNGLNPFLSSIQIFIWDEQFVSFFVNNSFIHDPEYNSSNLSSSAIKPFIVLEVNQYLINFLSQLGFSITFNSTNSAIYLQFDQTQLIDTNSISLYNYNVNSSYNITKTYKISQNIKLDAKYFPFTSHNFYDILLVQNLSNLFDSSSNQATSFVINPVLLSKVELLNSDQFTAFNSKIQSDNFKNAFLLVGKNILGTLLPSLYQPYYYNEINDLYLLFQNDISSQFYFLLIVIFPFVLIGIFITDYSFNLLSQPLIRKLNNFKQRGMSRRLLVTILLIESIIILVISSLTSLVISYIIAYFGLQANGYLSISIGNFPIIRLNSLLLPSLTMYLLLIFLVNSLPKIIFRSKIEFQDDQIASDDREPYWKKHNFDLLVILLPSFLIALYLIAVPFFQPEILAYYNVVIFLPFILIIGFFMVTGRTLLYLIGKLTIVVKNSSLINLKMGINLLNSINKSFLRGFIIITVLIFMTNFFAIYTVSLQSDMLFRQYSDQGFDLEASSSYFNLGNSIESYYNQTVFYLYNSFKENITLQFYIRVYSFSENNYPLLGLHNIRFFLMNVSQALFLYKYHIDSNKLFSNSVLENLISSSRGNSSKISILAHKNSLDNFGLINQSSFSINNVNFQIVDTFTNFPDVVPLNEAEGVIDPMPVIIDASNLQIMNELVNDGYLNEIQILYGFNFKTSSNSVNIDISKTMMENLTSIGMTFNSVPLKLYQFKNQPSNIIIFGQLLLILFMTSIMIIVVILLFIGNLFSQIKPILLLEKSLGGSDIQIFAQSTFVISFFIFSSVLIGVLYTIIPFQLYYIISAYNPFIVPLTISIPYEAFFIFYGIMIVLCFLIALIYNLWIHKLNLVEDSELD